MSMKRTQLTEEPKGAYYPLTVGNLDQLLMLKQPKQIKKNKIKEAVSVKAKKKKKKPAEPKEPEPALKSETSPIP